MLYFSYGYVAGYLKKNEPYTIKYSRSIGIFYPIDLQNYLVTYLRNNVNVISITEKGTIWREVYITVIPIVDNLTSDYLVKVTKDGIDKFKAKYTPQIVMADLTFVDVTKGSTVETIKQEVAAEREVGLPGWAKDALVMGGITVGVIVVTLALIKKA